jgi:hypothetical protein
VISTLLDVYADLERETWNDEQLVVLETRCRRFHMAFILLWELKTSLVNFDVLKEEAGDEKERKMMIMKTHNQQHFPEYIRFYGSPKHADTESWESSHRKFTKNAFERTSKRPQNLSLELIEMAVSRTLSSLSTIAEGVRSMGTRFFESHTVGPAPEFVKRRNRLSRCSVLYDIKRDTRGDLYCVRASKNRKIEINSLLHHTVINGALDSRVIYQI